MRINPDRILKCQPIRCPDCGAACFAEITAGPRDADRYSIECTCCNYRERVDIDHATRQAQPAPAAIPKKK